jgi:hypothetical protein
MRGLEARRASLKPFHNDAASIMLGGWPRSP